MIHRLQFLSLVCSFGYPIVLGIPKSMFKFATSDYPVILKTAGFVDKTLMIRDVLDEPDVILVTTPPKFGKSTNLDMIKRFLEIEVNSDGSQKSSANLTEEPVRDTSNYELFVKHELNITRNVTIMDEHFGKTPVLQADFHCSGVVKTYEEAEEFCKEVIHKTYCQYPYLLTSDKLTNHQKMLFERWYNETTYRELSKHHIVHGLRVLTVYLYRHFGKRRVFVLIDNHDSIIEKSMFDVEGAEVLRKIIGLSVSAMSTAVKNNVLYVRGGVISGISDMPVFGFCDLNNVRTYRFLGEHKYIDYYGLTEEEASTVMKNPVFGLDENAAKEAQVAYNGYQNEGGKRIYNTYSLLRFIKTKVIKDYWTRYGTIKKLKSVFKIPTFKNYVQKLTEGKAIDIVILEVITVEDVIDLRNLLLKPQSQINYWPASLFNYLFKQGYFTILPSRYKPIGVSVKKTTVRIPNTEVMEFFRKLK